MSSGRYQKVSHFRVSAPGQVIVHHHHYSQSVQQQPPTLEDVLKRTAGCKDSLFVHDGEKWVLRDINSLLKEKFPYLS